MNDKCNDAGAVEDLELPTTEYAGELSPGGLKRVKTEARRSDSMYYVPPEQLVVMDGFNIRIRTQSYLDYVRELADSIKDHGYDSDSTILVYVRDNNGADELVVIDGHTRLEAVAIARAEGADIDAVPVIFAPKSMNIEDAMVKLKRRNGSRSLTAYELAILCKRQEAREFSHAEIARSLSITAAYVASLLLLASAPRSLINLVVDETVTATLAIQEIRAHGPEKAAARLKAMAEAQAERGKGKVTNKNRPEAKFESGVKKAAPKLFERVKSIHGDPGYASLSQDNRDAIDQLMAELEELRKG